LFFIIAKQCAVCVKTPGNNDLTLQGLGSGIFGLIFGEMEERSSAQSFAQNISQNKCVYNILISILGGNMAKGWKIYIFKVVLGNM
jgi:hypothetical protein